MSIRRRRKTHSVHIVRIADRCFSEEEIRQRLKEIARCHVSLRSVFIGGGTPRPLQVILKQTELSCFFVDLRSLASREESLSGAQENYLRRLISLHRQQPPDGSKEVPFRMGLVRVAEKKTAVFLYLSHLMLDAAGITQVIEQLLGCRPIEPDAAAFGRFLYRLCRENRIPAQEYWKKTMGGTVGFTPLPSGTGSEAFVHDEAVSDSELLRKIGAVCARRSVTVSAVLHLAVGEALMDLLGLQEVCFASTTSGRDAASAHLAGMFINHFPIVVRRGDTPESLQAKILDGMRFGYPDANELPCEWSLPGLAGKLKLNVENAGEMAEGDLLPVLMRGDWNFAAAEAAATQPPRGIDGELTLMVFMRTQFRLDCFYSPASVDRAFVKRFSARLLTKLRQMAEQSSDSL